MKKIFLLHIACLMQLCIYAQGTIKIHGICANDSVDVSVIWLDKENNLVENEFYFMNTFRKVEKQNGCFDIDLKTDSACVYSIHIQRPYSWHRPHVILYPGDTLSFVINNINSENKIEFTGQRADEHNYYAKFKEVMSSRKLDYKVNESNLDAYKNSLLQNKEFALSWLEKYSKDHKLSQQSIEIYKANIVNDYISQHCTPFRFWKIPFNAAPKGYWDDTAIIENPLSRSSYLTMLFRYVLCYTDKTYENFELLYNNITQNFKGYAREYTLCMLIGKFALRQGQSYSAELLEAIKRAPDYTNNPTYLDYIRKAGEYYQLTNKALPDSVLNNTYLKSLDKNEPISLKEVLERYVEKAMYIDFWASWCTPCRENIKSSEKAKQLLKQKEVTDLYISLDKNEKAWKTVAQKLGIEKNQYCLINPFNNPLYHFLNIKVNGIPRYILLDKTHKVKSTIAPRPNPDSLEELKQCLDQLNEVVYF